MRDAAGVLLFHRAQRGQRLRTLIYGLRATLPRACAAGLARARGTRMTGPVSYSYGIRMFTLRVLLAILLTDDACAFAGCRSCG